MPRTTHAAIAVATAMTIGAARAAGPPYVDLTWMSIANVYFEIGSLRVMADGYFTRLPQGAFFGSGGGLGQTRQPFTPDVTAVTRVFDALGGRTSVGLLLTGHSHFDHSFDTPTWSTLTGARIIGSKTTCFQAVAWNVTADRRTAANGGERM